MNAPAANPPPAPLPQRSWLFRGTWRRLALVALAGLAILVGAFYAEEDWRGQKEWNEYQQAMKARGISLEYQAYIPKPVPEDENFASAPGLPSFLRTDGRPLFPNDLYTSAEKYVFPDSNAKTKGHYNFTDLVAWQMAATALQTSGIGPNDRFTTDKLDLASRQQAAAAVLEAMKPDEGDFAALRSASARPYSRFPIVYNLEDPAAILLPHLAKLKQICQHLSLQACAELAAGQTDQALADVKLMCAVADSLKTEPMLISFLVRVSCFHVAVQSVWEGLAERRWTDAQLQELETKFQGYHFLADLDEHLKVERAFGVSEVNLIQKRGLGYLDDLSLSAALGGIVPTVHKDLLNLVGQIMPSGWYEMERRNHCAIFDAQMAGVIDVAKNQVSPARAASNFAALTLPPQLEPNEESYAPSLRAILEHRAISLDMPQFLSTIPAKAAAPQTVANQAAIACALERYRLAQGQFPETLEALAPQYITLVPDDVLTGQPYLYRRNADGEQFVLYSVGWNEKDDGGIPGNNMFDREKGDWVWDYPVQ